MEGQKLGQGDYDGIRLGRNTGRFAGFGVFFSIDLTVRSVAEVGQSPGNSGDNEAEKKVEATRARVVSSIRKLRQTRLTMLQAEIINRLIDGRRTATELAFEIFNTRPGNPGFEGYYSKIRRDLRNLVGEAGDLSPRSVQERRRRSISMAPR